MILKLFYSKIDKFLPEKLREALKHQGFKRYFANTGWMFLGQIFSLLVSFFVGAWLGRYLGPENFGILNYALAFAGLFTFLADLGIGGILNRELIKFPEKRDELLGTGFRLKILGGIIAFLLAITGALLIKSSALIKVLIVLFAFSFILQAINVISIFFYSIVKSKNNVRAAMAAALISSILKIAVILLGQGVIWIMFIYVLDSIWQGIGLIISYRRFGLKINNWKYNRTLAFKLLKDSWPLMLASATGFIYLKIDQVMIGWLLSNHEVGLYAAAVKLVEIWYFIPGIICGSLFPAIINAKITDSVIYKKRLKALYLLMIGVALAIAIPSTLLANWAIVMLYGSKYLSAGPILQIYAWSGIGLFVSTVITQYFLSENRSLAIFYYNFFSMVINIAINLILIPLIGLTGAAWATLISYLAGPIAVGTMGWFNSFRAKKLLNNT